MEYYESFSLVHTAQEVRKDGTGAKGMTYGISEYVMVSMPKG